MPKRAGASTVLFGAFDRHNFGDLLFPHLFAAQLPGCRLDVRGLAARDLRRWGGHDVRPLAPGAARLVHVGGELLTCTAWQAAVMLQSPAEAARVNARYDADPTAAAGWAAQTLGCTRSVPYVAGRALLAPGGKLIFNAVGGVEFALLPLALQDEVTAALRGADWLSVRDRVTQAALREAGIDAPLCPDPAVMVRQCLDDTIRRHGDDEPVCALRKAYPNGYLACQFSGDFADDASLDALARGLLEAASEHGLGVVLFRAGAAPWHDDATLYARLLQRLPRGMAQAFDSLHLWDLCALIAASRGVVASSLHARLVALAYALPRVSLALPQQHGRPGKVAAWAATWEPPEMPGTVPVDALPAAVRQALGVPADVMQDNAATLCVRYQEQFAHWARLLPCARVGQ
ncbi:MAG: polysaccharide pyruvyl transferase family protein [Thiobacillus sp.]